MGMVWGWYRDGIGWYRVVWGGIGWYRVVYGVV